MTNATLDRILGVQVAAVVATGLLTLRAGDPSTSLVYVGHAVLAWGLAASIAVKLVRSAPPAVRGRRWGRLAAAAAVAWFGAAAIAGGVLWATADGVLTVGGWTVLSLHAYAGLALLPLLLVHLVPRRWRLLWPSRWLGAFLARAMGGGTGRAPEARDGPRSRPARRPGVGVSRRSVVASGGRAVVGFAVVGLLGWGLGRVVDGVTGNRRRFTGSRWLPPGGIPPPTTFFGEGTPAIDAGAWRLAVRGRVRRPRTYSLADLLAGERAEMRAVLDCTGGWAMETVWQGVPVGAVLAAVEPEARATRVEVRSVTGWGAGLSLEEASRTLLATHVAGEPLPPGNGAPCRLVVPDRRGLDWVKWVAEIEVA